MVRAKKRTKKSSKPSVKAGVKTLAIDIGGTGLKALVLDARGEPLTQRQRVETPRPATPEAIVNALVALVKPLGTVGFDRISVGFPGVVVGGATRTAPNLHEGWTNFELRESLEHRLKKPARVLNDAGVQGFGVIEGKGVEMVITLGTGFGTALYQDGRLCPHLEISQQPFQKGETYDERLGNAGRKKVGNRKWKKRVFAAIENLRVLTHFDHLYVGGGNSRRLDGDLPEDVTVVDNAAGLIGGAKLWQALGE